jgi:Chaperone of endosialidase
MRNRNMLTIFTAALLTLVCFGLSPASRALSPPPDGGYPAHTTAEGNGALNSLQLMPNARGPANNTALGYHALFYNVTGTDNTAVGSWALVNNVSGSSNTATGVEALAQNTADENTANGYRALLSNTTGAANTATGFQALKGNTEGNGNTANGAGALLSNDTGADNSAFGSRALASNTGGADNTALGNRALFSNTADGNTAVGGFALLNNTTGDGNTAVGDVALPINTEGNENTAVGVNALFNNTEGDNNTAIGAFAGTHVTTATSVICIGAYVTGADVSNSCYIGNIWNQAGGSQAVYVNSEGKLGALVSSRRFKDDIKPMEQASEVIYCLKPVSFRYKKEIEPTRPLGFGLIAEEVERISPDLVTRGGDGKANAVRYDAVNAMLLNEFLKEHEKVEKLEAALEAVNKRLKEQDANIRKVNAQLEVSKPTPQVVLNDSR